MKSGGPWNLRGLRAEARAAANEAARRSGMSVGEWLNDIIKPDNADDRAPSRPSHAGRGSVRDSGRDSVRDYRRDSDTRNRGDSRNDEPERDPYREPDRRRERDADASPQRSARPEEFEPVREREPGPGPRQRYEDEGEPLRREARPYREGRRRSDRAGPEASAPPPAPRADRQPEPQPGYRPERRREPPHREQADLQRELTAQSRRERQQQPRRDYSSDAPRVSEPEPARTYAPEPRREPRPQPRFEYPPEPLQERPAVRREPQRYEPPPLLLADDGDLLVDQAVAEITARQRVLDAAPVIPAPPQPAFEDRAAAATAGRPRAPETDYASAAAMASPVPVFDTGEVPGTAPPPPARAPELSGERLFGEQKPLPLAQQPDFRRLDEQLGLITSRIEALQPSKKFESAIDGLRTDFSELGRSLTEVLPKRVVSEFVPPPVPDFSRLEEQLRLITSRIESLRPSKEIEIAIDGLRGELRGNLAEISRSLTEALPRRAVESLEIEIKALAQRIDHSRDSGVDTAALAGLERGLADVREEMRGLTPAESLIGLDEAVKSLSKKVDAIAAKQDPAALQQLEAAIGALRGIVVHVASNETLTKVAEEVRALAARIDGLAGSMSTRPALDALSGRIDMLATAIHVSSEAGLAVPRELEKLLGGLIEKLEWVQLTHTDHTALAHLEDRIAMLVKRLDNSDSRFGRLEGVERGLADLLVYIEQLRGVKADPASEARRPDAVDVIGQEVARTQDSLEAVHGTVEQVVDRLAMIESGMRSDRTRPPPAPPAPGNPHSRLQQSPPPLSPIDPDLEAEPEEDFVPPALALVETAAPVPDPAAAQSPADAAALRSPIARSPINPDLPPDHPLEPGSTVGRSAAERIAASEAVVGAKPPVIDDPGRGKHDFIAAARRAARTAAALPSNGKSGGAAAATGSAAPKSTGERLRSLIVAAAVVAIVVGGFHIVSRLFDSGVAVAPVPEQQTPRLPSESPASPVAPAPGGSEPPHALPDQPAKSGSAAPGAKVVPLPQTNLMPPAGADTAEAPASIPSPAAPPAAAAWAPGIQSLPGPAWPAAAIASAFADKAAALLASRPVQWAAGDITGSVPASSDPRSPAGSSILPAAIGPQALRTAALAGDPAAAYEIGVRFADGRLVPVNTVEAARWFDRAAKKGLAPAQFRLGSLYEKGVGVRKDLAAARDLYRAAAEKGHGKAMHNLAVLYAEGIDGKPDYRSAAIWFRKAADGGISDSQFNLAVLYARGVGVEQSFAESYKWFVLAAREGDRDAAQKRDEVAGHLDAQTLAAAKQAAEQFTPIPQPADALTARMTWDTPATESAPAKSKARPTAKAGTDAVKAGADAVKAD